MSTSPSDLLGHIKDEAEFLRTSISGVSSEEFARNAVLKRACVRAIEVIGEATKKDLGRSTGRLNGRRWQVCGIN